MICIGVCDDNIQFAHILVEKIRLMSVKMVPERVLCEVINEFSSAKDVIDYLSYNTLDILFLDIEMKECHGFDLAKELKRTHPDIIIVFVSSHENLVFKSFDYNPLCFLRKNRLEKELSPAFARAIDASLYSKDTLDFSTTEGDLTIRVADIIYIESQKNYYVIHCPNNTYKCRGTISQVEQYIKDYDFCRIHAAYLINLDHVYRIHSNNTVSMDNKDTLSVSQRRYADFKNEYAKYLRRRNAK